ncbi:MAG: hypothetical protein M3279_02380 [Actinomycetota bacterium]|nr:hypothetical protein [Actinomycetota bacterium]
MKKLLAAATSVVVVLGACGGDDEPAARATSTPAATTPPPASEAPAESAAPATAEPYAGPTAGKDTPQEAAQAFYADWGELDGASASGYATQAAIDEAFAQQRAQATFSGCTEDGLQFICFYYYEGGGLNITVVDSDAYGWIVTDVGYIAD